MASEYQTLSDIKNTGGGLNPAQLTRYNQLSSTNSQGNSAGIIGGPADSSYGGSSGVSDPIQTAQRLLDFQKTANAPVVSALQGQVDPLKQRYTDLITQIKGNQTTAENRQTLATSNELGARGILPTSGLYQQEQVNALNPITTDFSNQLNTANTGESADLADLATRIATAQAGDPTSAASAALNFYNTQQAAQTSANSLAAQQAAQAQANQIAQATLANQTKQTNYDVGKPYYAPTTGGSSDSAVLQAIFGNSNAGTASKVNQPSTPSYFKPTTPVKLYQSNGQLIPGLT